MRQKEVKPKKVTVYESVIIHLNMYVKDQARKSKNKET